MVDRVLTCYLNKRRRLAFISIFKIDGNVQRNADLNHQYGKAKWAYKAATGGSRDEAVKKYFDSGFGLALLNTDVSEWRQINLPKVYTEAQVETGRDALYERLSNSGFKEVGSRHFRATNNGIVTRSHSWGRTLIKNLSRDKIALEVERMTVGLDNIPDNFASRMYLDAMRLDTIDTKADLFLHIRQTLELA